MSVVERLALAFAAVAPDTAAAILGEHPDVVFCGSINAFGGARRVDGGYRVTGRWQYASGCDGADYFWGGCQVVDAHGVVEQTPRGHPVMVQAIVPRAEYTVIETWLAAGLCGSGSHDVEVADVFVPDEHVTDIY